LKDIAGQSPYTHHSSPTLPALQPLSPSQDLNHFAPLLLHDVPPAGLEHVVKTPDPCITPPPQPPTTISSSSTYTVICTNCCASPADPPLYDSCSRGRCLCCSTISSSRSQVKVCCCQHCALCYTSLLQLACCCGAIMLVVVIPSYPLQFAIKGTGECQSLCSSSSSTTHTSRQSRHYKVTGSSRHS
jgi:hypothetical protein